MSDEYNQVVEETYSSFWPVLVLLLALVIWLSFQDYELFQQRNNYAKQVDASTEAVASAKNIETKYVALMNDLLTTAQKDQAAAKIVRDAIAVGLIRVNNTGANGGQGASTTNSSSSSTTPSDSSSTSNSSTQ